VESSLAQSVAGNENEWRLFANWNSSGEVQLSLQNSGTKNESLFLKACSSRLAGTFMCRPVINPHNRLRAVAPEMARSHVLSVFFGKSFFRRGTGEHFFGAQMFAEAVAHT
jgi:hypothetical protein